MSVRRWWGALSFSLFAALGTWSAAAAEADEHGPASWLNQPVVTLTGLFGGSEDGADEAAENDATGAGESEPPPSGDVISGAAFSGGDAAGGKKPGPACDAKKMKALKKAAATAYKDPFFENDFNYLCDPCYDDWHLGEDLKRNCLGDWGVWDIGGQFRLRYENQHNFRGGTGGITGTDDQFLLYRTRLYADVHVQDYFRVYAEMLDAVITNENFRPRLIDENRTQIQNLFGDLRLYDGDCGDAWARVGRQEMLYGVQRLVSPLDWANTRRTFEGYKGFWKGEDWDVDGFFVRPVIPDVGGFDGPDQSREFAGVYSTYKGRKDEKIDLYWLHLNETAGAGFEFETFGGRWAGKHDDWLWDHEAAVQPGSAGGNDAVGGMFTFGLGRQFDCVPWDPKFFVYYDWASGNATTGGFNDLFPLTHYWLGFMDLYARRNITDFNLQLTLSPSEKLQLLVWYHMFNLQNSDLGPFNGTNLPYNPGNTPGSAILGNELDVMLTWKCTPRSNIQLSYSRFWAGAYYQTTPGAVDADADFVYTQFLVNF